MGSPKIGVKGKPFLEEVQKPGGEGEGRAKGTLRAELSWRVKPKAKLGSELGFVSRHLIIYS